MSRSIQTVLIYGYGVMGRGVAKTFAEAGFTTLVKSRRAGALAGLPDKVTASEVQITKDDKEAIFELTVDPNCGTGSHRALFCNLTFKKNAETTIYHTAHPGIVVKTFDLDCTKADEISYGP